MKLQVFVVDAFARERFAGNPAAVVPLDSWLYDTTLHAIAAELNLPATAFIVPRGADYEIRWLTPTREIELCGHGTLAAGHVVLRELHSPRDSVRFEHKAETLVVSRTADRLSVTLPRAETAPTPLRAELVSALGATPRALLAAGNKTVALFAHGDEVAALAPDFAALAAAGEGAVIATAPGEGHGCDFVSRYFGHGGEDPVTGSAHAVLVPYWAAQFKTDSLLARQISKRGGEIWCQLGNREVTLSGHVTPFLVGEIEI